MVRLYFYVEGQTEQEYVRRVLTTHLWTAGVQVMGAVLAATGRKHGHESRGGVIRYEPMRRDLGNLLRQHAGADVRFTTMFDLYGLHGDFPGWEGAEKQRHLPRERVVTLEKAFAADVADPRFLAHLQLHEFETFLLCDPSYLEFFCDEPAAGIAALRAAVEEKKSPELVNDGDTTAPSKRIIAHFPEYKRLKTTAGVEWAQCVDLAIVRQLCPHFDNWLKALETLGGAPSAGSQ
jgi:hypothetical protein